MENEVRDPEHPEVLELRVLLAGVLDHQGKYSEAETEARTVLKLEEKLLGPEHPTTLKTYFYLAVCLRSENQMPEAREFAQRAAEGARKVLGSEHPDTKKYEQLRQELLAKGG